MLPASHPLANWEEDEAKHMLATGRWPWLTMNLNKQGDDYQQGKICQQK